MQSQRKTRSGLLLAAASVALLQPSRGHTQAGPVALLVAPSARVAGVGGAWVAGRDEYTVFTNPAQVNATTHFGASFGTIGGDTRSLATAGASTIGPYTFGWGVHLLDYSMPRSNSEYPIRPTTLARSGDADAFSLVAVASAQRTIKGFRVGVAGKYAEDVVPREATTSALLVLPSRADVVLADIGVSRNLWVGTAALSVNNIAAPYALRGRTFPVPSQVALGWSAVRGAGQFDYAVFSQVAMRREGWVGAAGGAELSWGWIEGYLLTVRAGARRTECDGEKPVTAGFSLSADRLGLDYAIGSYDGSKQSHRITVRWR
ncbi:MAG: hypothetical protein FJ202_10255 [Gemmatimonadetes bacterium]|nr:hypothetical protein [Gemmatimonadota bacterium]